MERELLILRHAKSDWGTPGLGDFDRPLNGRGKEDAPRVGRWIAAQGLQPDYVVSSPAHRARSTARKVARQCGFRRSAIDYRPRLYLADLPALLGVLRGAPELAQRVMLVGHNPGLEMLLLYLAGHVPEPADGKLLPTATLARLALPADWSELESGCGRLLELVRPRGLEA